MAAGIDLIHNLLHSFALHMPRPSLWQFSSSSSSSIRDSMYSIPPHCQPGSWPDRVFCFCCRYIFLNISWQDSCFGPRHPFLSNGDSLETPLNKTGTTGLDGSNGIYRDPSHVPISRYSVIRKKVAWRRAYCLYQHTGFWWNHHATSRWLLSRKLVA